MSPTLVGGAALAVLGFLGGWRVAEWRADGERLQAAQTAAAALHAAEASRDALAARLATGDDLHAAELRKAQHETNVLRDRVSAGPVRLLVAAKCPGIMPQAASSPGVDPGPRAELDASARSAYFALRDGINTVSAQLEACQGQLSGRATADALPGQP